MARPHIEVELERNTTRLIERSFPDGPKKGYDVSLTVKEGTPPHRISTTVIGFATKIVDHWGRTGGWVVWDFDGTLFFGAGQSTKIGKQLSDCLYLLGADLVKLYEGGF